MTSYELDVVPPRKRIQRACDQCRRRKTKCDGEMRCKVCISVGLECSYGRQIRQTRGTQYIVHLENKVKTLEERFMRLSASPNSDEVNQAASTTQLCRGFGQVSAYSVLPDQTNEENVDTINCDREDEPSIVDGRVQMYRGSSTGIEILRSLQRLCNSFVGLTNNSASTIAGALDRPFPIHNSSLHTMTNMCLPSRDQLYRWINIEFDEAFVLWPFIDRELFNFQLQRMIRQTDFGRQDNDVDNLALIHAVIALGQRYDADGIDVSRDQAETANIPGIRHFGIAKELVGVIECSRSVTAVQVILCMCLYVKSLSAQRLVHTYVSMAGHAAHQLGLHANASASYLPSRVLVVRQRVYITLRVFDAYVSSSLGLPRTTRPITPSGTAITAPSEDISEHFQASDANLELLEILGNATEEAYFADSFINHRGPTSVRLAKLQEVDKSLKRLEQKYPALARMCESTFGTCTALHLFLGYSRCFVLLMLYSPFTHHVAKPAQDKDSKAYAYGAKGIEAAIQAVRIAEALDSRGLFNEAYPLTIDVLAVAATTLLVVSLGADEDAATETVRQGNSTARLLLERLAKTNSAAAQCLESLMPLHQSLDQAPVIPAASFEELMRDFTLFQADHSADALLTAEFEPFQFPLFSESPPMDLNEKMNYDDNFSLDNSQILANRS